MEGYRYQQFAYLIVPVFLGIEFFVNGRYERIRCGKGSARALVCDTFGFVFAGLIPLIFLFTIISLESHRSLLLLQVLHRMDRYGVMFFFLGAWWQVFLLTALRARRFDAQSGSLRTRVWLPYLVFGAFISALILWVAPWNMMWFSVAWFLISWGGMAAFNASPRKIAKVFAILAAIVFFAENVLFIILDSIV